MNYNEAKDIFEKAHLVHDITDINFDCLDINNLLNDKFDKNRAINKICSINDKHPDNKYIHDFIFPPHGHQVSIGEANEQSLRNDLEWKRLYLKAKSQAKLFDEFIKEVEKFIKDKESANK